MYLFVYPERPVLTYSYTTYRAALPLAAVMSVAPLDYISFMKYFTIKEEKKNLTIKESPESLPFQLGDAIFPLY